MHFSNVAVTRVPGQGETAGNQSIMHNLRLVQHHGKLLSLLAAVKAHLYKAIKQFQD